MISDWKENGVDSSNSTSKQLLAFMTIAAMLVLGGSAISSGDGVAAGAVTVASASSALLGYVGLAETPVARLLRTNMVSGVGAAIAGFTMFTGGMHMHILALMMLCCYDMY